MTGSRGSTQSTLAKFGDILRCQSAKVGSLGWGRGRVKRPSVPFDPMHHVPSGQLWKVRHSEPCAIPSYAYGSSEKEVWSIPGCDEKHRGHDSRMLVFYASSGAKQRVGSVVKA